MNERIYMAIDLKSFYASVECVARRLDPLTTNLVVADASRSHKTICLAVSPALKKYGIPGRARLFEVIEQVKKINYQRAKLIRGDFINASFDELELQKNPRLKLSFLAVKPRMAYYRECSKEIYNIYLKYLSPEDIHVYSIDEVFIDATSYLKTYGLTAKEFAKKLILDIYKTTKITATAGIGTNLYLCKVAMDIVAKHIEPDQDGICIAYLDEMTYRQKLWHHQPITDFWRVGKGYQKKLYQEGLYTMGDIARCSLGKEDEYYNEDLLYDLFGINAELLIDHAWGYEPCTMKDIKAYKPEHNSIGVGQVLDHPYNFEMGKLIVKEMLDSLTLDLVEKNLVTNQIVITIGYDKENVAKGKFQGTVTIDRYGRKIPKHCHGTINLKSYSASTKLITQSVMEFYDKKVDRKLTIKRVSIFANRVVDQSQIEKQPTVEQLDLFTDYNQLDKQRKKEKIELEKEKRLQEATLKIKQKYGKNALLKGMDFQEGATAKERNGMIGGHKA